MFLVDIHRVRIVLDQEISVKDKKLFSKRDGFSGQGILLSEGWLSFQMNIIGLGFYLLQRGNRTVTEKKSHSPLLDSYIHYVTVSGNVIGFCRLTGTGIALQTHPKYFHPTTVHENPFQIRVIGHKKVPPKGRT